MSLKSKRKISDMDKWTIGLIFILIILIISASLIFIPNQVMEETTPDSFEVGNYKGTYSFENEVGKRNAEISFVDTVIRKPNVEIIEEKNEHNEVLKIYSTDIPSVIEHRFKDQKSSGTIEFWFLTETTTKIFMRFNTGTSGTVIQIGFNNNKIGVSSGGVGITVREIQKDFWYHLRMDFDLPNQEYTLYLNQNMLGTYETLNTGDQLDYWKIFTSINPVIFFIDAIGYSWDPDYNIGDNYLILE